MDKYDIAVIGGGPAGYAAAIRALDFGKRVCLIEKDKIGGAGIYHGALSSKTLWELSRDVSRLDKTDRGYHANDYQIDYRDVVRVVNNAVEERKWQLEYQLHYFQQRAQDGSFRYLKGFGSMATDHEVEIRNGNTERIYAENIVLATGGRPRYLPDIPIDEKMIVTSDGIENFEDFPESLVILGAGVIGCEFATIFSNFGRTKVFIIDKAERILPFEDEDIATAVAHNLEQNGVTIHHGASLESMHVERDRVKYVLRYNNGKIQTYYAEKALVSVGRVTNIENLGCESLKININKRGSFEVDDSRTNIPNIYAVGDLTADVCLVNVGELEGRHAIEKIVLNKKEKLSYNNLSTIMFLKPEVAGVGLNEQDAQARGIPYRVASYSYGYVGRAIAMRTSGGFFKILVTDDEDMKILGMRVVGVHASSTIQAVAIMMHLGAGIRELVEIPHPHPSMPEGVQECARMLLGTSIIKPAVFGDERLRCHRVVNGVCLPIV
jgi:dihydrolipoamide dehydrogenase